MKKVLFFIFLFFFTNTNAQFSYGKKTQPKSVSNPQQPESVSKTHKVVNESIEDLEVAEYDFPLLMNWYEANEACKELGGNWRLPTKDELNILFKNKVKIGGFSSNHYWSSNDGDEGLAWDQTFDDGYQDFADMNDDCNVRAVRA